MGVIIRQSLKATAVSYLGAFLGFLTTFFVLTRYLTPAEVGLTRVLTDMAVLLSGLASLGTNSSIIRFFPYFKEELAPNGRNHAHGFWFWTLCIPVLGIVLFGLLWCLLRTQMVDAFGEKSALFVNYYYWVLPMAAFMVYQAIMENNANVLMRIVWPRFVREVLVRVLNLGAYLLYAFHYVNLDGFVLIFTAVYAVAALCNTVYLFLLGHIDLRPDFRFVTKPLVRDYGFYTLFVLTSVLGTALAPAISGFFLSAKMGLQFTGVYAIATYMAAMVSMPCRSLSAIVNPQVSAAVKESNWTHVTQLCQQVATNLLVAGVVMTFCIWFNIDVIYQLLPNGADYVSGRTVVLLLCLTQLLIGCLTISNNVLNFSKYYYYSLFFMLLLSALSIVFNNWFIPLWGINGAAMASLGANIIYFGFMQLLLWRKTHTTPFSLKQLWLLLIFLLTWGANELLTPMLPTGGLAINLLISALKTILLLSADAYLIYRFTLAPDLIRLLHRK